MVNFDTLCSKIDLFLYIVYLVSILVDENYLALKISQKYTQQNG